MSIFKKEKVARLELKGILVKDLTVEKVKKLFPSDNSYFAGEKCDVKMHVLYDRELCRLDIEINIDFFKILEAFRIKYKHIRRPYSNTFSDDYSSVDINKRKDKILISYYITESWNKCLQEKENAVVEQFKDI